MQGKTIRAPRDITIYSSYHYILRYAAAERRLVGEPQTRKLVANRHPKKPLKVWVKRRGQVAEGEQKEDI